MNILGRAKEDLPGIFGRQTDFRSSPVAIEPLPPSNNPTSFDNRFGDWRSSPAGAHRSPVLRELQRYERSDFQGGPQASGQGALAEMPVLQSDSARSFGEVGTFTGDRLIAWRQAASSTPAAPIPVASNLPGGGSDFGDGLGDALRGPKTDTHLGLPTRMLSSGIPGITRRDQSQPSSPPEPAPAASRCRHGLFRRRSGDCRIIPMRPTRATGSRVWPARPRLVTPVQDDAAPVLAHQFAIARNQVTIGLLVSKNLLRRRANHGHNFIVGKIQKPAPGNRTRDFRWTLHQLSSRILKQLAGRRRTTLLPPHFRDAVHLGVYPRKWR